MEYTRQQWQFKLRDQMRENEGPPDLIRSVYISLKNELYMLVWSVRENKRERDGIYSIIKMRVG